MSLPVNIVDLIHGKAIEWERLEFKKGWNPEEIVHTICAFANDLNNWGGGYVIVGVEEDKGQPVLPPAGLLQNQLDKLQGDILGLAHQILPNYFPIVQPYLLQDKYILVIWCPAGDNRPYTAPSTQGGKAERHPYIRFGSRSIVAKGDNLKRLQDLAARVPFDDRINGLATIADLDLGLIQAYLHEIKSDLLEESLKLSPEDLSRQMYIAKGAEENLRPVNAGILFFCKEPEKFLTRPWIELVWHKDFTGKDFTEKYFKGPLHVQLRAVLEFIQNNIIQEFVIKKPDVAEALRFFNFPFVALEEALSNAVYHKSYEVGSPIEVQIWPDKIEILSYPGPVPPVDAQILQQQKRIVAREYRNRRIGDFLKELKLTEGRGTGFPAIYRVMAANGSGPPVFETDKECTYFLTTLPVRVNDEQQLLNISKGAIEGATEGANGDANAIASAKAKAQANAKVIEGAIEGAIRGLGTSVKERLATVLNAIVNEEHKRVPHYAQLTAIPNKSVERYVALLREAGLISYAGGASQTGGYFITDKLKRLLTKT